MIREPFLLRYQWEAKLRRWGCQPLAGLTKLNTAEWWKGPRGLFTVAVEDDGTCEFWSIQKIAALHGTRPEH